MEDDFSVLTQKRQKHHHFVNHHQFSGIETISIDKNAVTCYTDCGGLHSCGSFCNKVSGHHDAHYCMTCHASF